MRQRETPKSFTIEGAFLSCAFQEPVYHGALEPGFLHGSAFDDPPAFDEAPSFHTSSLVYDCGRPIGSLWLP